MAYNTDPPVCLRSELLQNGTGLNPAWQSLFGIVVAFVALTSSTICSGQTLEAALDGSQLTFRSGDYSPYFGWNQGRGGSDWRGTTVGSFDGVDAAASFEVVGGIASPGGTQIIPRASTIETTVTGPATLTCVGKITSTVWGTGPSSPTRLWATIDRGGELATVRLGDNNYHSMQLTIPAGVHTVQWVHEFWSEGSGGSTTALLDMISIRSADAFENDDTAALAKIITRAQPQGRSIHEAGNVDWLKFTLTSPADVLLRTGPRTGFNGGDTVMYLYGPNSSTTSIAYNDDFSGFWSQITSSLAAGTYYVRIDEFGNDGTIDGYTLSFDTTQFTIRPDAYENDDTAAGAKTFPRLLNGTTMSGTQNHSIHQKDDADWAKFTLPVSTRSLVLRTGSRTGFNGGDTEMWLYGPNSSTTEIAHNDDYNGLWSQINGSWLPAGTYYVRIQSYNKGSTIDGYTLSLDAPLLALPGW